MVKEDRDMVEAVVEDAGVVKEKKHFILKVWKTGTRRSGEKKEHFSFTAAVSRYSHGCALFFLSPPSYLCFFAGMIPLYGSTFEHHQSRYRNWYVEAPVMYVLWLAASGVYSLSPSFDLFQVCQEALTAPSSVGGESSIHSTISCAFVTRVGSQLVVQQAEDKLRTRRIEFSRLGSDGCTGYESNASSPFCVLRSRRRTGRSWRVISASVWWPSIWQDLLLCPEASHNCIFCVWGVLRVLVGTHGTCTALRNQACLFAWRSTPLPSAAAVF